MEMLKNYLGWFKGHRNKIFLACKTKFRSSKDSTKDLENFEIIKNRLFDLYQLHGMKSKEDYEEAMENGVIETLDKAKKDGKIKHVDFLATPLKLQSY